MGITILRILGGVVLLAIGCILVIKSEWFLQNFGSIAWAEQKLGTEGGSRLMYKLIGLVFIFIGFIVLTGMTRGFLMGTVGKVLLPPGAQQ